MAINIAMPRTLTAEKSVNFHPSRKLRLRSAKETPRSRIVLTMGEVVFHAGSKLSWLESIARDRSATAFDLRVAIAISNRTKGDGIARNASQQWIARYIGATERGVRKSIVHLEMLMHLEPIRNALGDGGDGRPAFGGNGHATEYRLLKVTRNGDSGFGGETRNSETRNSEAVNPEQRSSEPGTTVPPISILSNKDSLAHVRARARGGNAVKWQAVKNRLAEAIGRSVFDSWFSNVALAQISDGVAILRPPTKFVAKWLTDRFHDETLKAWRAELPALVGVRFDHRAVMAHDDEPAPADQPEVQR